MSPCLIEFHETVVRVQKQIKPKSVEDDENNTKRLQKKTTKTKVIIKILEEKGRGIPYQYIALR